MAEFTDVDRPLALALEPNDSHSPTARVIAQHLDDGSLTVVGDLLEHFVLHYLSCFLGEPFSLTYYRGGAVREHKETVQTFSTFFTHTPAATI